MTTQTITQKESLLTLIENKDKEGISSWMRKAKEGEVLRIV